MTGAAAPGAAAGGWGVCPRGSELDALMRGALDIADGGGASYADARVVELEEERLYVRLGADPDARTEHSLGIGVRVLKDGAWGFASRPLGGPAEARQAARAALAVAAQAALAGAPPVRWRALGAVTGAYATPCVRDPFAVPASEKEAILDAVMARARHAQGVVAAEAGLSAKRQSRHFLSTEGSAHDQELVEAGGMMMMWAASDTVVERRSYPNTFHGDTRAGGFEGVTALGLPEEAQRVAEEASALTRAPVCPAGVSDLVIGPAQICLQIHESAGHALELDRILGTETSFAGTSFVPADGVGTFRYGSPAVNLTADATVPGARGGFGFDDEGQAARRVPLVRRGILSDFLSSRETAAALGQTSTAAMRADGWAWMPLCFATNVILEPGEGSLEALLDRLGDGYMVDMNRSWSIDDRRENFQFGTEFCREVRHGRPDRLMRRASYGGVTPEFWRSVEAVAGPEEFRLLGFPCGKGEPKQWGFVSHGASPVLARGVRMGVEG